MFESAVYTFDISSINCFTCINTVIPTYSQNAGRISNNMEISEQNWNLSS